MRDRFMNNVHVVNVGTSGFIADYDDAFTGTINTDVVSLKNYDRATWVIAKGAGATGSTVVTVSSCDTAVPGTATPIAFTYKACTTSDTYGATTEAASTGFTTTVGADQIYLVEVNADELSGTDKFVRLTMTESVNSPCDGAVVCILSGPRYMQDIPKTAIS